MELGNRCPFCGGNDCERNVAVIGIGVGGDAFHIRCEKGFDCTLYSSIWLENDGREIKKRLHQIYLLMIKSPYIIRDGIDYKYCFFYDEKLIGEELSDLKKVNVAELMKKYPKSFMEKMEKALYNLSKRYPIYGYVFSVDYEMTHLLYCEGLEYAEYATEAIGTLNILCELGYLSIKNLAGDGYCISAKGWEKVSELEKAESNNQGFIAMSFRDETKTICDAFKAAIAKCGYIPRRIDEKEHNNQIVPEILFEISRSKFVVVDVTYPNYGAYYEAGYAEALGKEVIICCRGEVFNSDKKPHFDIAQKSSIVWKDEEDLENRLYRRIEATVGLNK